MTIRTFKILAIAIPAIPAVLIASSVELVVARGATWTTGSGPGTGMGSVSGTAAEAEVAPI